MPTLALFWSRVALSLYTAGLIVSLLVPILRRESLYRLARATVALGFIFHFVSLVEISASAHELPVAQYSQATSLLAFVITGFFLLAYRLYSPRALSIVVCPLIFVLMLASIYGRLGAAHERQLPATSVLRSGWIYAHATLIFLGYAALVLAFTGDLLYLIHEHQLKARPPKQSVLRLLPALSTLERLSYRSLLAGFPLLTAGLLLGIYAATHVWGTLGLSDPKILIALLTWALYLILLFSRWSAGWRGRRAAYATILCFTVAVAGWLSSGISNLHGFLNR